MNMSKSAYWAAVVLAAATALFVIWAMGAVGILGIEGDPADRMYLGVLGLALGGSVLARFRASDMPRAMFATAAAVGVVGLIALLLGKQEADYSSTLEIVGLTGMFAALFAGSGWLFRSAHRSTERG